MCTAGRKSEEFLGKALKGKRSRVILATKFGAAVGPGKIPFARPDGLGKRQYILQAVEASLNAWRPITSTCTSFICQIQLRLLKRLCEPWMTWSRLGKIRYTGCSNLFSWELCEALWVAKIAGLKSFESIQSRFSLLDRYVEDELIPCCETYHLSLIPWFPLAGECLPENTAAEGRCLKVPVSASIRRFIPGI